VIQNKTKQVRIPQRLFNLNGVQNGTPFKPHGFGRVRQFKALIFTVLRILIFTHPDSDPGSKTATKERGEKNFVAISFL
jgi:hypothetical protein